MLSCDNLCATNIVYIIGASLSEPLSGVNVLTGCAMFVCVCVSVCVRQNLESVPASPSKFGGYVKVQRSTDSPAKVRGEGRLCYTWVISLPFA